MVKIKTNYVFYLILIIPLLSSCTAMNTFQGDYQQYQINNLQSSQWQNNFNQDYYKNVQEPANNWYRDAYKK